ncbi:MAG: hypothetical protein HKN16_05650 [Saprospiraceae bacterium]|nr:hypothetical protein [Saprospiraceae bacterium]
MFLFFDVSAAGEVRDWKKPATDPFNWPRLAHLSWLLYNNDRELVDQSDDLVKPTGWEFMPAKEKFHHITHKQLTEEGKPVKEVLERFGGAVEKATYGVAHNMHFNESVIKSECYRQDVKENMDTLEKYCLMREATWFCKIQGRGGKFKWPKLQEIHAKLFQARYDKAGHALADVSTSAVCFFGLVDLEAIDVE